jgi:hypothetical protein
MCRRDDLMFGKDDEGNVSFTLAPLTGAAPPTTVQVIAHRKQFSDTYHYEFHVKHPNARKRSLNVNEYGPKVVMLRKLMAFVLAGPKFKNTLARLRDGNELFNYFNFRDILKQRLALLDMVDELVRAYAPPFPKTDGASESDKHILDNTELMIGALNRRIDAECDAVILAASRHRDNLITKTNNAKE